MAALLHAARAPGYPATIGLVLSNQPSAPGIALAAEAGVATASSTTAASARTAPRMRR